MPKTKTHSGASKRVKVTGSGNFKMKRTGMRHLQRKNSKRAKRRLSVDKIIRKEDAYKMRFMMKAKNAKRSTPALVLDLTEEVAA